jgi:hypothetical protein
LFGLRCFEINCVFFEIACEFATTRIGHVRPELFCWILPNMGMGTIPQGQ